VDRAPWPAASEVDLAPCYRDYGLHRVTLGPLERLFHRDQLRFLRRHVPLGSSDPVLDFGCGGGRFLQFLRQRGFGQVAGWDPYAAGHRDRSALQRRYRLVRSTDVVDQVPSPGEQLVTVCALVAPDGFLNLPAMTGTWTATAGWSPSTSR
jgi:2-polyprenyl-3-methyl-5-hydroxy-6-metoxy-1,4-benzoquinol methylase